MRRNILAITMLMICSLTFLTACGSSASKVDNVEINIGESVKFSKEEIEKAVDVVVNVFLKDSEHIELHSLSYDEEYSDFQLENYREDVDPNNIIVLSSDFYVDSKAGGAWNPDSDYNWMFILSRNDKNSDWILDDWGY